MRTYVPKISFVSTSATEKERLLYQTAIIASGFYLRKGFIITPTLIPKIKSNCVVVPEFLSKLSPKYWHDAVRVGPILPIKLTDLMKNEMSQFNLVPIDKFKLNDYSLNWAKVSTQFWQIIIDIFPKEIKWIGEIEVRITNFGAKSSFSLLTRENNQNLIIHLRPDASIDNLAWGIISSFFWPRQADGSLSFSERSAIVDFVMSLPQIKKVFPRYSPPKNLSRLSTEYSQKSLNYCRSLGINFPHDCGEIINSHNQIFGTKELKILNKLIDSENDLVTNDNLADILWGEDNFFSYWAINKMVQRIRKKLSKVKLKSSSLVTVRGRGYKWIS